MGNVNWREIRKKVGHVEGSGNGLGEVEGNRKKGRCGEEVEGNEKKTG